MCRSKQRCGCESSFCPRDEYMYITRDGTYRLPRNAKNIRVSLWGGGGGGGGGSAFIEGDGASIVDAYTGGGGGASGYVISDYKVKQPIRRLNVVIGGGGVGGFGQRLDVSNSTNGGKGGDTIVSFDSTSIVALGGEGGTGGYVERLGLYGITVPGLGGVNSRLPLPIPYYVSYNGANGGNGNSVNLQGGSGKNFVVVPSRTITYGGTGGRVPGGGGGGGAGYNGNGANGGYFSDGVFAQNNSGAAGGGGSAIYGGNPLYGGRGGSGGSGGVLVKYNV